MKYKKIMNLLDNRTKKLFKIRTKNWVEIADDTNGRYVIIVPYMMHIYLVKELYQLQTTQLHLRC